MQNFETYLQYFIGFFYFYHGLNGFFYFQKLPMPSDQMLKFVKNIEETKFILPTVKSIEIISGVLLLMNQAKYLAILLLVPIVFGITISQIMFNLQKGKRITVLTAIPFFIFLILILIS